MKAEDTASKQQTGPVSQDVHSSSSGRYSYTKVVDGRKQPIRGLYQRNGAYFARITTIHPESGQKVLKWYRLTRKDGDVESDVTNLQDARKALERVRTQRDEDTLPVQQRTPKFADYAAKYVEAIKDTKRPRTIKSERVHVNAWIEYLGPEIRVDKITTPMVRDYIAKRLAAGWKPRTVNLGVVCLRCILKRAIEDKWIQRLPTETIKPLKWTPPRKKLITAADIDRLCKTALENPELKNAREFVDYIRFLQFTGARCSETFHTRWADVSFDGGQITIGWDGDTKNGKSRVVDLNPQLAAHLREMRARRAPDSQWLFPSPRRGEADVASKTFRETLCIARASAELPGIGFHHFRHYFISTAVMAGIDFMTIAAWVGHLDGGVLIGKVYGHLADSHKKQMADKLTFGPVVLEKEATA